MGLRAVLRKAGIVALDYAYALRHQLRGLLDRRPLRRFPPAAGGEPRLPVLLIPGVYERWRFLRPLARHLEARGHEVHVVDRLHWNIASAEAGARTVARYLAESELPRVAIVAHSKGGLIARRVLELRGDQVAVVVAVATPFAGSPLARLLPIPGVRALGPAGVDVHDALADAAVNARIVSVVPWFDPHIPGGAALPGSRTVPLSTGGHFRILSSAELFRIVDAEVEGPAART
jgi:pimeloyl-ACP methyl ester carboxylesterase